jgi:hypothetical protein
MEVGEMNQRFSLLLAAFAVALAARIATAQVTLNAYVDDYAQIYIDGALVGSYDAVAAGNIIWSVSAGWHSIAIDYKNRYGSNCLALQWILPPATDYSIVPRSDFRSLDHGNNVISGLHADYYDLSGVFQFTVYGEAPIWNCFLSSGEIYQDAPGLWAGVYGGFDVFEERLSGDIFVPGGCEVNPGDVNRFAGGPYSRDGKPTSLIATFTPTDVNGLPVGLDDKKRACDVKDFNWEQTIMGWPSPSTLVSLNPTEFQQVLGYAPPQTFVAPPKFPDPPPGGYTYFPYRGWASWDSYPFYYDANFPGSTSTCLYWDGTPGTYAWALSSHETTNTLCFLDAPADTCLLGGSGTGCGGFAQQFSDLRFTTKLVGIRNDNSVLDLYAWDWISTFNGTSGGVSSTSSLNPVDPGSGTGGVTITSINGVPQTPPSVSCTATPNTLWPPNGKPVSVTVSGILTPGTSSLVPGGSGYLVIDEYGQDQPSSQISLGSGGSYLFQVSLIAARNGNDTDGRTYTIIVNGQDALGNVGSCSAIVTVPHDQGR